MKNCTNKTMSRYSEEQITCGTYQGGEKQLCDKCFNFASFQFPQGWKAYPGDTCKHGVYVGGCGVDLMCADCETE